MAAHHALEVAENGRGVVLVVLDLEAQASRQEGVAARRPNAGPAAIVPGPHQGGLFGVERHLGHPRALVDFDTPGAGVLQ
jgi:hypothetical protein